MLFFFFFNDTATTEIYTLSLHDALPIWSEERCKQGGDHTNTERDREAFDLLRSDVRKDQSQIGRAHVWTPVTL